MLVTRATLVDIPELCDLLRHLFSQEAEFHPDSARQARGLATIIANPSIGIILKLAKDRRTIGMVNILLVVSTFLGEKAALLEDLIIHPEFRGAGDGTHLLQTAIDTAAELGCKRITLLTDGANEGARRFYEKAGFQTSKMVPYRLALP